MIGRIFLSTSLYFNPSCSHVRTGRDNVPTSEQSEHLHLYSWGYELNNEFMPCKSKVIAEACHESVDRLVSAIRDIDEAVYLWNDVLEMAQPFLSGRLLFKFLKSSQWLINGVVCYEYTPVAGKMIKFQSGRWRFVKLDEMDQYEKLSDLRVGKSYDSDRLVRRLIDGIDDILKKRQILVEELRSLRRLGSGSLATTTILARDMVFASIKLREKVKTDWRSDIGGAIQKEKEKNRIKYEKRKQRRTAQNSNV